MFWIALPEIGIGQIWVVVAVFLIALFAFLGRRSQANERLKQEGIPGTAQILEAEQTGMYVNNQPQVKLRLRVEAHGIAPYEVHKRVTVPLIAIGALGSGRPLTVAVDPTDRDRIAIDWGASAAAPATPTREVHPRANSDPRAAVLEALGRHGIDAAHGEAAADPATSVASEAKGEPLDRLTKLMQLRAANLITDEELHEYRKRILDGV
ncbi:MAG TPA: hypothetical protein VK304_00660 [Thermoleophilaceae bacterium]|nr:hypothetical protein [Thermoleophilaceae bacterium]